MADLTTLTAVKQWLGLQNNADDALITSMVSQYSEAVQTWLGRDLLSHSVTEKRSGTGGAVMAFSDYPVTAVAAVAVNGQAIAASAGYGQAGYQFDDQFIYLTGYAFPRGTNNVQLQYTAGFATTPPDIARAVIELIALRFKEKDRIGHSSKSLAGETVSYIVKDFPDSVRATLDKYKKVIPI